MIFKGIVCTGNVDSDGYKLSPEVIQKFLEQGVELPVTFNFSHNLVIGTIKRLEIGEKGVEAEILLNEEAIPSIGSYIVPSIKIEDSHKEGDTTVIDKCEIIEFGLTLYPSDTSLTPIEKKGGDETCAKS